jgi:hypothetical protein
MANDDPYGRRPRVRPRSESKSLSFASALRIA